ncbi:hypothetical protein BDV96DRAFT_604039 [Lophiotrema nucula]|uniref:Uncharacterized protein n=1 Tax=Lophiotrema nucula TaxID=690887 RepID=A0A6A5YTF5_9PLEO|nr:hypothetical protein BDV96DRAFT_604039 [Lophiotrema nucula]
MLVPKSLFATLPLITGALAGVFVQGFNDPGSCNQGIGGTTITGNGNCVGFNTPYTAIQVAGGGSDSCFLQLYHEAGCQESINSNIGPINNPNLGGCIGPFDINGSSKKTVKSGRLLNCPT